MPAQPSRLGGFAFLAIVASTGAAAAEIRYEPTTCPVKAGASLAIQGAGNEFDGVASEYAWLRHNRPDWRLETQAVINEDSRVFDLMTIARAGERETICFDITAFYLKF